ncbi:uncharacterized protein TM35_000741000, partial [Trypanosoma theileri]
AAAVDNDSPSGRGVSRGAVEVSCGAGGALRVRPAAASEWLTCGAGSRVSACGKYADLCRQRTARTARTTTIATTTDGQLKAVMAFVGSTRVDVPSYNPADWEKVEKKHWELRKREKLTFKEAEKLLEQINKEEEMKNQEALKLKQESEVLENAAKAQQLQAAAEGHVAENTSLAASEAQATALTHKGAQPSQGVNSHPNVPPAESANSTDNSNGNHGDVLQQSSPAATRTHPTVTPTTGAQPSEGVHSNSNVPQTEAKTAPDNSSVNPGGAMQHSSPGEESTAPSDVNSGNQPTATPSAAAISGSEETNTTIPANTGNAVSEESTATPSLDSNLTTQSTATDDVTAAPASHETNTTTPLSPENTTTEAPTTTLSPSLVPNAEISSIASAVQKNKGNADSSIISSVWVRVPLLIVAVLVSATVY